MGSYEGRMSEEQNNESQKQKVPAPVVSLTDDVTGPRSADPVLCSGPGGEREAEAGERREDEEEGISDEGAGEAPEAARRASHGR